MNLFNKAILFVILIITSLVIFNSCNKKSSDSKIPSEAIDVELIKSNYYKSSFKMISSKINDSLFIIWRPMWNQITLGTEAGGKVYYIPLNPEVASGRISMNRKVESNEKRFLVARLANGKFEYYTASRIDASELKDASGPFTGKLLFNRLGSHSGIYQSYSNGKNIQNPTGANVEGCLYYSTCTWVGYCDGVQTVVYTRGQGTSTKIIDCGIPYNPNCPNTTWYSGWNGWDVYCTGDEIAPLPPPANPNNPAPGGVGGGGGSLGGGGGGNYKLDTVLIAPSLTDPCFQWAVNQVLSNNMKDIITSTFNMIFGGNGEYTIVFDQGSYGDQFMAKTHLESLYYIDIVFNTDQLSHSSKELIVASALHEMLHGIFDARKTITNDPLVWNEAFQHNIMVSNYINNMSEALQSLFPDLSWEDAQALSYGGLQSTNWWTYFKQGNPVEANNILLRAQQFDKNNTKGHRCP
ncbi:hypothetical protein [Chitinophaga sp. 212800010-3]|uniref:hypothetical protein n=1 Tax=unclassified Chitinophaga TaxID=2619133 RepID=UPI002DED0945|nr:hypothetical protein [Chitinophaga sp. 212800010-3]